MARMCEQCDGISERFDTNAPDDYRQFAHRLARMIERGSLRLIGSPGCSLDDVAMCKVWPGDVIVHQLGCTRCDGLFELHADTYHGRVEWSGRYFEEAANGA